MRAKTGTDLLKRKAGEVKRYRQEKKIVPIIMACLALVAAITYVISLLYTRFGSFTVRVDKYQELKYRLSLSETKDFAKPTSNLDARSSQKITNIDGNNLPKDLGSIDGLANGTNYMCYTFYVKNTGTQVVDFEYSVNIVNMTMDIEQAIRLRFMESWNGGDVGTVTYARASSKDGSAEPGTEKFYTSTIITYRTKSEFKPNDYGKFTVVLWLEGNDPECLDNIIGGEFKIDMKFSVTSSSDVN